MIETKQQLHWRQQWQSKAWNQALLSALDDAARLLGPDPELRAIARKNQRDIADARALQQAERAGNRTKAAALREQMRARNLGVDV